MQLWSGKTDSFTVFLKDPNNVLGTSFILNDDGSWSNGPLLDSEIYRHCICPRTIGDNDRFILVGGLKAASWYNSSYDVRMYDFSVGLWSVLPDVPESRVSASCGPYTRDNGEQIILHTGV